MSWFRPRAYGYGATPSHWKGWAAVAAFVAVEAALARALLGGAEDPPPGRLLAFLAVSAGLVAVFVRASKPGRTATGAGAGAAGTVMAEWSIR